MQFAWTTCILHEASAAHVKDNKNLEPGLAFKIKTIWQDTSTHSQVSNYSQFVIFQRRVEESFLRHDLGRGCSVVPLTSRELFDALRNYRHAECIYCDEPIQSMRSMPFRQYIQSVRSMQFAWTTCILHETLFCSPHPKCGILVFTWTPPDLSSFLPRRHPPTHTPPSHTPPSQSVSQC